MTTSPNGSVVPVEELRRVVRDLEAANTALRFANEAFNSAQTALMRANVAGGECHKAVISLVKEPTVVDMGDYWVLVQSNGQLTRVKVVK